MRRTIFAFTVTLLAPTAVMASTSGQGLVRDYPGSEAARFDISQIVPGSLAGSQGGFSGDKVILAKGDKSGTGPGLGGQKGQKKGGGKGKQKKDKD